VGGRRTGSSRGERQEGVRIERGNVLEGGREGGWEGRNSSAHSPVIPVGYSLTWICLFHHQGPDIGAAAGLEGAWAEAHRVRGGQGYVVE